MIRLKTLLEAESLTTSKTATEGTSVNMLTVGDVTLEPTYAFNRRIAKTGIVIVDEEITDDSRDLNKLVQDLQFNVNEKLNLAVLYYDGLPHNEDTPEVSNSSTTIQLLDNAIRICREKNVPIVLNTIPNIDGLSTIDEINNWILQSEADFVLDVNRILNSEVFYNVTDETVRINAQGHALLAKALLRFIKRDFDVEDIELSTVDKSEDDVTQSAIDTKIVQQYLNRLGYKLNPDELKKGQYGNSTKRAIKRFQRINKLNSTGIVTVATYNKLKQQADINLSSEDEFKIQPADFQTKLKNIAQSLGVPVEHLLGIMKHESGLNPGEVNTDTGATGLIQFMPKTAIKLGTTTAALKNMSAVEQLDYVEKFYKPIAGKAKDIGDLYMYTFVPAAVGKPDDFKLGIQNSSDKLFDLNRGELYDRNKGFDKDNKGYFTVGDVRKRISEFTGIPLTKGTTSSAGGLKSVVNTLGDMATNVASIFVGDQPIFQGSGGSLLGAVGGGYGGNWAGTLPKLISILPPGTWKTSSQKRDRRLSASGRWSDHNISKSFAYGADFGLNTTFAGDKAKATEFAIAVARNAGDNITSWAPYVGRAANIYTNDGYRVQIIWQSNVGGNHYDHVHVGIKSIAGEKKYNQG